MPVVPARAVPPRPAATAAAVLAAVLAMAAAPAHAVPMLTDAAVYSSNEAGHTWNAMIFNTAARPADVPDRFNLYWIASGDPAGAFVNAGNTEPAVRIGFALGEGEHRFRLFSEGTTGALDAAQHWSLNLYFGGDRAAPRLTALAGPSCAGVCTHANPRGENLDGTAWAPGAGALSWVSDGYRVAITAFSWSTDGALDRVGPYGLGASGVPDFVGDLTLRVEALPLPLPGSLPLAALGLAAIGVSRLRRRGAGAHRRACA